MSKAEFSGKHLLVRHTVEEDGPHLTEREDHFEDAVAVIVILRGSGKCFLEGNTYQLTSGDIITLSLDEIHSFHFDDGGYHERLTIYFSSSVLSPFWEYELPLMQIFNGHQPGLGNHYSSADYDRGEVESVLAELCRKADLYADSCPPMEEARIHLLVLRLLFALYDSFEKKDFSSPNASGRDSVVSEICRYIRENPAEDLSYQKIQNRFYVSRYFLTVVFRNNTGITLTEYILHTRLMKVSALIRQGENITKAAEAAGFRNYSHFYKEFKKRKNISPRKYYGDK